MIKLGKLLIKLLKENNDPLTPQNNNEKLLDVPIIAKTNNGDIKLIGQESGDIYWDDKGNRYSYSSHNSFASKYSMGRYELTQEPEEISDEGEGSEVWENAYTNHEDLLKTFVENVLEVPFKVNMGMSDGDDEDRIFIHSKIYGSNPTIFTTYHNTEDGEIIDYEYDPYKPLDMTSDQVEQILHNIKMKKLGL